MVDLDSFVVSEASDLVWSGEREFPLARNGIVSLCGPVAKLSRCICALVREPAGLVWNVEENKVTLFEYVGSGDLAFV